MASRRPGRVCTMALLIALGSARSDLHAQGLEISPFYGYRFGGDFFALATHHTVDLDGAPAFGLALDVPVQNGLQVEGFFTHQEGDVVAGAASLGPIGVQRTTVQHWMGGALQEFGGDRVRPFATGMLGLTRYAGGGDSEIRFTVSGGGGAKLFGTQHIGLRLDGRISATFIDAQGTAVACVQGGCFIALHTNVVWQAEFTTGLIVRFP